MRILHVSSYFRPARSYGGSANALYRLCLNLAALGCEVHVLTTDADGRGRLGGIESGKQVAVAAGMEVTYTSRLGFGAFSPRLLMRLPSAVRGAHLVHLTGVYCLTVLATLFVCRLMGRPLVWSPRGELQRWRGSRFGALRWLWERLCLLVAPRAAVVLATSETESRECARRLPRLKAVVVQNGIRIPAVVEQVPAPDGTLRLGYIGRLHPRKGLENLIDACARLGDPHWSLTMAGSGRPRYTRALAARVRRLGLSKSVRMPGDVRGVAKRRFFESIDLLVLPSHTESAATAVAEALAFGLPVIAGRQTPWSALDAHGCGRWIENDPQSLAGAIEQMRALPLVEMGRRGREWMAAEFSWQHSARQVCNLYSVLIGGAPALHEGVRPNAEGAHVAQSQAETRGGWSPAATRRRNRSMTESSR